MILSYMLCRLFCIMFLSAVDCGKPHPLKNGSIIGENTVYPNFVAHQCDEGFILRGPPKIKCQANGTWSRTSTFCEGIIVCDEEFERETLREHIIMDSLLES